MIKNDEIIVRKRWRHFCIYFLLVYLIALLTAQIIQRQTAGRSMKKELERMWKEVIVQTVMYYSRGGQLGQLREPHFRRQQSLRAM
jgi:hypothetical protein